MKRLIVCCDGTWNGLDGDYPTNVLKLAQGIQPQSDGVSQLCYYQQGLGTNWYDRLPGGAFGWGIDTNIKDVYRFLCLNYSEGDEIYLFGFSRGAYTVRSLAGLIYCAGLLKAQDIRFINEAYETIYRDRQGEVKPDSPQAVAFRAQHGDRVPITALCCWDTVGALGIPNLVPVVPVDRFINRKYAFHDTELSPIIQHAFQAIAIDERRKPFAVTPMTPSDRTEQQVVEEKWLPGVHGCVGGGTAATRGLSDRALLWMLERLAHHQLSLKVNPEAIEDGLKPNALAKFQPNSGFYRLLGFKDRTFSADITALDTSALERWCRSDYRPANLTHLAAEMDQQCDAI